MSYSEDAFTIYTVLYRSSSMVVFFGMLHKECKE
jgi:hypothetical protein